MDEKRCTKCGKTKPLSEFHKNPRAPDGLNYWCGSCTGECVRALRAQRKAGKGSPFQNPLMNDRAWLVQRHLRDLKTIGEIAAEAGVCKQTVWDALHVHRISTVPCEMRILLLSRREVSP
ncbi:MAG: hypothetical protein WC277_06800 [Bacilli bacterium]|jgi:hypothetical protein